MPHSRAYSSARRWSRLATATSSTFGDSFAPGISFRLMSAVEMIPHVTAPSALATGRSIAPMARPVTLFTGQWADLPLEDARREGRPLGLRRARARLLGRPLRGRPGARRAGLRGRRPGGARAQPPELLRARRAPRRAGRLRPDRRAPPRDPAARGLGRRRAGGRQAARGRADEGHRARRRAARRHAGERLHRLGDLAHALLLPAERLRPRSSAATRSSPSAGARSSTSSTRRACASGSRCTRPRSPTTSSRRGRRWTRSATGRGVRDQPRPEPLRPPVPRRRRSSRSSSPTASTTCTSRTRSKRLDGRRSILGSPPQLRRGGARLGLRLARARRRRLRGALPGAEPDRLHGAALDRVGGLGDGAGVGRQDALAFVRRTDFTPSEVAFDAAMQTS